MSRFVYIDKRGNKTSKEEYEKHALEGEVIRQVLFGSDDEFSRLLCRVTLRWEGKHDAKIPFDYITPFTIVVENNVNGRWIEEPIYKVDKKHNYEMAIEHFGYVVSSMSARFPYQRQNETSEVNEIDDTEDYGQEPIKKDVPKTKSKFSGSW